MDIENALEDIAGQFDPDMNVEVGKWFGKPCIKVGGKAFVVRWGKSLAMKLTGDDHSSALALEGSRLFDPRGKGSPMKEWVQIPSSQADKWLEFAEAACAYVTSQK